MTAYAIGGPAHSRAAEQVALRAPWRGQRLRLALVAFVLSLLATIYPARNATRITPAEVLRYE